LRLRARPSASRASRRDVALARIEAAVRGQAGGHLVDWARALGATLTAASRTLGAVLDDPSPLAPDVRAVTAKLLGCTEGDLASVGMLSRRLLRELPRHFPPPAERPRRARRDAPPLRFGPRPSPDAVRATLATALGDATKGGAPWAKALGPSLPEAARSLATLFDDAGALPDPLRATAAAELGVTPGALATWDDLARRLVRALPAVIDARRRATR
jgi:hypothetical protein